MLTIRILNIKYTKIIKSLLLGEGDAGRSGFYSASYFGYDGVPEFTFFWQLRVQYFDTHYTTVTDIVDRYNLKRIIGYVNRTDRLEF